MTHAPADQGHSDSHSHAHQVPLFGLFLALLALTAAEVGLYEIWRQTEFISKLAIVLLILVFTLPKALIVLVYFMHLRFEKQTVIALAIVPFIFAFICVLPTLTDVMANKGYTYSKPTEFKTHAVGHGNEAGHEADDDHADDAEAEPMETY